MMFDLHRKCGAVLPHVLLESRFFLYDFATVFKIDFVYMIIVIMYNWSSDSTSLCNQFKEVNKADALSFGCSSKSYTSFDT